MLGTAGEKLHARSERGPVTRNDILAREVTVNIFLCTHVCFREKHVFQLIHRNIYHSFSDDFPLRAGFGAFPVQSSLSASVASPEGVAAPPSIVPPPTPVNDVYGKEVKERADALNKALADLGESFVQLFLLSFVKLYSDFPFDDLRSVAPFVHQEELQPISDSLPKVVLI